MTSRRAVPLVLAAAAAVVVACVPATTDLTPIQYGFLTIVAQQSATGYTTSPIGTFYQASGLGVPLPIVPWDSCQFQQYSATPGPGIGDVYPSINAGSAIAVKLPGRIDSLYQVPVGNEMQYLLRSPVAVPYTPGDSVSVVVPGSSTGYPAFAFSAKTAESFAVTDFTAPAAGARLDLKWNAGQDLNSAVVFSFRFGALKFFVLDTQIYCEFRDNGTDSIPARYISSWSAATTRSWVASRVRTYVAPVAKGYFEFISTFDLPTPVSP